MKVKYDFEFICIYMFVSIHLFLKTGPEQRKKVISSSVSIKSSCFFIYKIYTFRVGFRINLHPMMFVELAADTAAPCFPRANGDGLCQSFIQRDGGGGRSKILWLVLRTLLPSGTGKGKNLRLCAAHVEDHHFFQVRRTM